jgi:hypothetical protein
MYGIWEQTQNTIFKTLSTSYSPEVNMNREIIEKWIKRNHVIPKKFKYYLDEESFRFRFNSQINLGKALEEVPHIVSYNMWDETTFYIFLNHPNLNREKLYALLFALESALKSADNSIQ